MKSFWLYNPYLSVDIMKYVCALVVVEDIERSRSLFENVLGQSVKMDYGENVVFEGGFALHQRSHFQELIGGRTVGAGNNGFELYFETDELVSVVEKVRDAGLEFVHEIVEQPWKQRVVRFYDYDGNLIEIGETMEHVAYRLHREGCPPDEIGRITYLSPGVIQEAIEKYSM